MFFSTNTYPPTKRIHSNTFASFEYIWRELDETAEEDLTSMLRTFYHVLVSLSKCQGHEVLPGLNSKGRTTWLQTHAWQIQQTIVPHSPRQFLSHAKVASWKAQFMYQNKLSSKALALPFRVELTGQPKILVSDINIQNVNGKVAQGKYRKLAKQARRDGQPLSDTFAQCVFING